MSIFVVIQRVGREANRSSLGLTDFMRGKLVEKLLDLERQIKRNSERYDMITNYTPEASRVVMRLIRVQLELYMHCSLGQSMGYLNAQPLHT